MTNPDTIYFCDIVATNPANEVEKLWDIPNYSAFSSTLAQLNRRRFELFTKKAVGKDWETNYERIF